MVKLTQFDVITCEPTGRVLYFDGETVPEGINNALYYFRLSHPTALGPTGRVLYTAGWAYAATLEKSVEEFVPNSVDKMTPA